MSNKAKATAETNVVKSALVPKLRFPEFRNAPEWEEKYISDIGDVITGNTPSTSQSQYYGGKWHFVSPADISDNRYIEITKTTLSDKGFAETRHVKENSTLFVCIGSTIGKVAQNKVECATNQQINSIVPNADYSHGFVYSLMELHSKHIANIAGNHAVPIINKSAFGDIRIRLPRLPEQQRIADLFSSLDELIAAQALKVETLEAHKKGLMQLLFPAEGETTPKLRFPEFRNAQVWGERELGTMATKVGSGITPTGGDTNYKTEGRPFVRSQNVGWGKLLLSDVAFIDEQTHRSFNSTEIKISDVLLNITGASIGRSAVADSRIAGGNVNQHVCIIRVKQGELNPTLLNQFLISKRGQKQIDSFQAGGNRQGLNFVQIRSFKIPLPPTEDEQRKIADCLSLVDELIAVQAQRVEALKAHKRGLMRQLFPVPEVVK